MVEIGGHTNGIPEHAYCDRLSTQRAKAVAEYLVRRGIKQGRLKYKGYGKRQPVATNKTPDGRKRNQRVEIKILSLSGWYPTRPSSRQKACFQIESRPFVLSHKNQVLAFFILTGSLILVPIRQRLTKNMFLKPFNQKPSPPKFCNNLVISAS